MGELLAEAPFRRLLGRGAPVAQVQDPVDQQERQQAAQPEHDRLPDAHHPCHYRKWTAQGPSFMDIIAPSAGAASDMRRIHKTVLRGPALLVLLLAAGAATFLLSLVLLEGG